MAKKKEKENIPAFEDMAYTIKMSGKMVKQLLGALGEAPAKYSMGLIQHIDMMTKKSYQNFLAGNELEEDI